MNNQKGLEVGGFGTHTFDDGKSGVASKNNLFRNNDSLSFVGVKYSDKKDNLIWEQKMNKSESTKK